MTIKGYSFKDKKMMDIVSCIEFKKYVLPNGNTSMIVSGKTKNSDRVSRIISNYKDANCKPKPKTKTK